MALLELSIGRNCFFEVFALKHRELLIETCFMQRLEPAMWKPSFPCGLGLQLLYFGSVIANRFRLVLPSCFSFSCLLAISVDDSKVILRPQFIFYIFFSLCFAGSLLVSFFPCS